MRIAFLANRDIQSNFALNILTRKDKQEGQYKPEAFHLSKSIITDLIDTLYSFVPIPLKKV